LQSKKWHFSFSSSFLPLVYHHHHPPQSISLSHLISSITIALSPSLLFLVPPSQKDKYKNTNERVTIGISSQKPTIRKKEESQQHQPTNQIPTPIPDLSKK
jgi:hypothetical protein